MNNNWFIESISLVKADALPTKEEMEKLLPLSWPPRWEEIDHYAKDGLLTISLAHINPYPNEELGVTILKQGFGIAVPMPSLKPEKFDFVRHLNVIGCSDKQTARQFFESHQAIPVKELMAPAPGLSVNISLGDLIKTFAPKEVAKEFESALEKGKKEFAKSGVKIEKGKYLGEEAILIVGESGKIVCSAVLINNFVIMGELLMSDALEPGSTPIHFPECKCKRPYPCSTRKAAGYVHREEVEQFLMSIFARIKGNAKGHANKPCAEIMRGQNITKNPKGKSIIEVGDTIRTNKTTQVNITDTAGNKISIGGKTEIKMDSVFDFQLIVGTVTAFIKKLQPKTKFEVHTPTSAVSVRGTAFSLFTDYNVTTLTVIEGDVEFSDLKGNKVMVKDNQSCICYQEQGLQNPVTLPVNLKEQYKEM